MNNQADNELLVELGRAIEVLDPSVLSNRPKSTMEYIERAKEWLSGESEQL